MEKRMEIMLEMLKQIQAELERRTDIEQRAEQIISEGKYEESMELLQSLDDGIIWGLENKYDRLQRQESLP